MTVLGRSLFHNSLVRICKEIRSWYMSPFQIGLVRIFVMLLNWAPEFQSHGGKTASTKDDLSGFPFLLAREYAAAVLLTDSAFEGKCGGKL